MAIHPHILHNGAIHTSDAAVFRPGQIGLLAGWGVFTTLRVCDGALFAWDRHWARMSRDARLLNLPMPDPDTVQDDLLRLLEANQQTDCTLRLAIVRNSGGMWQDERATSAPVDVAAMTATSKHWGDSVRLGLRPNARHAACEFAGAKLLSWAQNLSWAERALQAGDDEVILLNEHGRIAECTSANVFVVQGSHVFTPPLTEGCLGGITREILLELSGDGLTVEEKPLDPEVLYAADAAFITSTTRNLLPIREVSGQPLSQSTEALHILTSRFHEFVAADLRQRPRASLVNA